MNAAEPQPRAAPGSLQVPDVIDEFTGIFAASPQVLSGLRSPRLYANSVGNPLFGYSHTELPRAAMEYAWLIEHHEFARADVLARNLRVTLEIEDQACWILRG